MRTMTAPESWGKFLRVLPCNIQVAVWLSACVGHSAVELQRQTAMAPILQRQHPMYA